jgi:hypothetical protein
MPAVEGVQSGRYFKQLQDDRLVGSQHLSRGNSKCELIADLTGSAGDRYANGSFHYVIPDKSD